MVAVTARLDKNRGTFGRDFDSRIANFEKQMLAATQKAVTEADRVSKARARGIRPPSAPRPGRRSPAGALAKSIHWHADPNDKYSVMLDQKVMDANVPWWRVQEIGTGKSATVRAGGKANPKGRPTQAATYKISVKKQFGRLLPGNLVFVDASGNAVPFSNRSAKQALKRTKLGRRRTNAVIIRNEIVGKHFIREGAQEGFRDYRQAVVAAARSTLSKKT